MRKRIISIFFIVLTLLFLSSCGTPTVIDFTDAVSMSRTEATESSTLTVSVDEDEFENVSTSDLDSASPSVLLLDSYRSSAPTTRARTSSESL